VLIYCRHGDDRGENVYRHDRPLNDRGRKHARKEASRLIKKLGHPDVVYVSPFRRARETLACMTESFVRDVETHVDPRVAQRLSRKQRKSPSLHPETLPFAALDEDDDDFRARVADHVREAKIRALSKLNVLVITHQGVIEQVAKQFGIRIAGDLDFLDYVVVIR